MTKGLCTLPPHPPLPDWAGQAQVNGTNPLSLRFCRMVWLAWQTLHPNSGAVVNG